MRRMGTVSSTPALGLAVILAATAGAGAQDATRPAPPPAELISAPGRPGWIVDPANGCWLWNPAPEPGEAASWTGNCPGGPASGNGTAEWRHEANGQMQVTRYTGLLSHGRLEGWGVITLPNGERYEGEWRDGRQHGLGLATSSSGVRYDGGWQDGRPAGRGVATLPNGDRYVGGWHEGRQAGRGVATSPSGWAYDGEWRDGRQNGRGTLTLPDGSLYRGEWRDGRPHGQGEFSSTAGSYQGVWRDGCLARGGRTVVALGRPLEECRQATDKPGRPPPRPSQPR